MSIVINKYNIFKEIQSESREMNRQRLQRIIQEHVENVTDTVLGRSKHRKTITGKYEKDIVVCPHCQENWNRSFVRNGYSKRTLVTLHGVVSFRLPIIKCKNCGKKFRLNHYLVPRHIHTWYDIHSLCTELYGSRCSFGMLQQVFYRFSNEWLGKYTLMNIVRRLPIVPKTGACPSEVGLDAFWVRSGTKDNAVVLLATNNDTHELMDFMWAPGETEKAWKAFVARLEKNFSLHPNILVNIVQDGHKSILSATEGLSQHRTICFFHVLQNIVQNSHNKLNGKKMVKLASKILKYKRYSTVQEKLQGFINTWHNREPKAIGNFLHSMGKLKNTWELSDKYSTTNNITENLIRQVRRKSRQMDNFRTEKTTNVCLEMIKAQVGQFKTLGNWFAPLEQRLICA